MIEGWKALFHRPPSSKPEDSSGPNEEIVPRLPEPEVPANPPARLGPRSYHRAKEIIEREINSLREGGDDQNLTDVIFQRKKDETEIGFKVDPETDFYGVIASLVGTLGTMEVDSCFTGNITLTRGNVRVYLSHGLFGNKISFLSKKELTDQEIESILKAYKLANAGGEGQGKDPRRRLTELGATVYDPEKAPDWDYLAGYSAQKQQVRETIINSFLHPETYEQIARGTRKIYESNRPRAVLFEGPPGTGKTTMARMIAGQVEAPLVYVPIESIMNKWYGESERNLAEVFSAAEKWGGSMIFLDEIDSLATSRDNNIHEATRRVLSVLLRKIDGINPSKKTILIGATNRKGDLDPALLSRFDTSINFPLPNKEERQAIFSSYARHLDEESLALLAKKSESFSGRDIRNLCERAERSWASKLITGETELKLPIGLHYLTLL